MNDYKRIEDYGIIGNLDTCALVGKDGSIDWCCLPHIESSSIFAAILDIDKGGYFSIKPENSFESTQKYVETTNVLQTVFQTSSGIATLTDFMPLKDKDKDGKIHHAIYRKLTCNEGVMNFKIEFQPRFNYARAKTSIKPTERGIVASGNDEQVFLNTSLELQVKNNNAFGTCQVKDGDTFWVVLQYERDFPMNPKSYEGILKNTLQYWENWAHDCGNSTICVFYGAWHDLVVRSGLILKLLFHQDTGAVCAAPTTSLPEEIGGERNFDYRFNWIRDASFTAQALYNLGHIEEAKEYLKWFIWVCMHDPSEIQIMYGLHGELDLKEEELDHLAGYRNSSPVRIGNAAAKQKQLDIYGELVNAFYETTRYGAETSQEDWSYIKKVIDYVCQVWNTKDSGIWEVRSGPQHFVYSKIMCWVALDRGIKIVESKGFEASLDKWKAIREEIKDTILQRGFNKKLNSFVQSFDSEVLDATGLLIPILGFLPFEDSRVRGTIDATIKYLTTKEGLVYRYKGKDGLPGKEGAFVLCTFWLVDALALSGRIKEAEKIFKNILKYASPLGLLSEEIDPNTGELLGNYPQAFSHIGLINSGLYLGRAKGREQIGPEPLEGM